jgi:hypothetical protein
MKKRKLEQHFGVPPESVPLFSKYNNFFITHKSSKKGKVSFLITKALLDSLMKTSLKIQKQPKLVISIADEYIIDCTITKLTKGQ